MFRATYFFVFLLLPLLNSAQNWNLVYSKEIEAEQLMGEKQFDKAAEKFKEALKLVPNSGSLSYKVGICYLFTDDSKHLAIEFLEKAAKDASPDFDPRSIKETKAPIEAIYHLGRAYQIAGELGKAKSNYKAYKDLLKPNDEFNEIVDLRITSCGAAEAIMRNPIGFKASNLGSIVNSISSNFNAVLSGDENTLAYTSLGKRGYEVFVSKKENGEWAKPVNISKQLGANVKTSSLSNDGTQLYLIDDFDENNEIYVSKFVGKKWGGAEKLPKPVNTKYKESHASISADSKTLYFTSNSSGGLGGLDIYKTTIDAKGKWSKPENLGPNINTKYNEETPFISSDGRYLYFSSEGHGSMGGYDIFYVDLKGNSKPVQIGYPINTTADNLFFFPGKTPNTGYLSMHDANSLGSNDIYKIKIMPSINLLGNVSIKGGNLSSNESNISISIIDLSDNKPQKNITTPLSTPTFTHVVIPGSYQILAEGSGFQNFSTTIEIPEDFSNQSFPVSIALQPVIEKPILVAEVKPEIVKQAEEPKPKVEQKTAEKIAEPIVTKPKEDVKVTDPATINIKENVKNETKRAVEPTKTAKPAKTKPATISTPVAQSTKTVTLAVEKNYTVQIMALRAPLSSEKVPDIPNLSIIPGADGYYRYLVGQVETIEEAKSIQQEVISNGYTGAFVRAFPKNGNFTIQVMALNNLVPTKNFGNLQNVIVFKGSDGLYRYCVGMYSTIEETKAEMAKILELGYKNIFIRSI